MKLSRRLKSPARKNQSLRTGFKMAALLAAVSAPSISRAATLTFDPTSAPTAPAGGAGAWNLTTANWSNGATDQVWTDTTGTQDSAVFPGTVGSSTASTVALGANLGALGITFNRGGYTISGNFTLTLGTGGLNTVVPTTAVNLTDTISSNIALTAPQTWTANSAVISNTTYTNNLTVSGVVSGGNGILDVTKAGGGVVNATNTTALTVASAVTQTSNAGTINISAPISGEGLFNITKAGAGTTNFLSTTAIAMTADRTLTVNAGNLGVSAPISGVGFGLTKAGAGNLNLSGATTYTGTTTISAGSLAFISSVAQSATGNGIGPVAGSTVNVASGATLSLQNSVSGTSGTNTPTVNYNNFTTNLNGSTVTFGNGNLVRFNVPGNFVLTGTNTFSSNNIRDQLTLSGVLSGTGGLIMTGTGAQNSHFLVLSGANTYGGSTAITASTAAGASILLSGGADRLPTTTTVTINGSSLFLAQLNLGGQNQTLAGLVSAGTAANAAVVNTGTGTPTLTLNPGTGVTTTFAGILGGANAVGDAGNNGATNGNSFALTKTGAGVQALSGANLYTGATAINGGILDFQTLASLPGGGTPTTAITVASGAILGLGVGTTGFTSAQVDSVRNAATFAAGGVVGLDTAATAVTYAGTLTNNTAGTQTGFAKLGTAVLTLTGTNTYTGGTTLYAGTLNINADAALGTAPTTPTTNLTFAGTSTTLQAGADGIVLNANRSISLNATTSNIFDSNGNTLTVNGAISGAGPFTKAGAGTLILAGNNTFSGGINFAGTSAGNIRLASGNALGDGTTPKTIALPTAAANLLAIELTGNITTPATIGLTTGGRPIGTSVASSLAFLRNVSGDNTFGGNISFSTTGGSYYIDLAAGTLTLSGTIANTVTTNAGSRAPTFVDVGNAIVSGLVQDGSTYPTGITQSGTGTVSITNAANTYAGVTTITSGTLNVASFADINVASSIGKGSAAGATTDLLLSGGTLQYTGTTDQSTNRPFQIGTVAIDSSSPNNSALKFTGTGPLTYLNTTARTLTLTGSSTGANTITPILADATGATSVTKTGAGTWILAGANTFTGATTVTGGILSAAAPTGKALGGTTGITISGGGTLLLGTANQVKTTAPITMGTAGATPTSGILSVAAGANQGTAVTVTVTGGTPAAGNSAAGLGALTLNSTATLTYSGAATTLVFGLFTPNGNVLNITGYTNAAATADGLNSGGAGDDRLVFSGTAGSVPTTNFAFNGNAAGFGVTEIGLDTGFYEVAFTAVPEPSTWVGGLLGLGMIGFTQRRRMGAWLGLARLS